MNNILVTGALGQIGSELIPALQSQYPQSRIYGLDIKDQPQDNSYAYIKADIRDRATLASAITTYEIDTIYHLVSLLSATGEGQPDLAWDINITGLKHILDLAREHQLKIFWPSSIAAFGPSTPHHQTPQNTILQPTTMYGVTKVSGELLCQYYHHKYRLDVRSLRYPGLISWKTPPGGGTTDYAVAIFYQALKTGTYDCFVSPQTSLPMMYMDDAIQATIKLMQAPSENLTVRTSYNLAAISFTAAELASEIQKHTPLEITYTPDHRQAIADSWPSSIDDSVARHDWGWQHQYDLSKMTVEMLTHLKANLTTNHE